MENILIIKRTDEVLLCYFKASSDSLSSRTAPCCWNTVELQAHRPQTWVGGDPLVCGCSVVIPPHLKKSETISGDKRGTIAKKSGYQLREFSIVCLFTLGVARARYNVMIGQFILCTQSSGSYVKHSTLGTESERVQQIQNANFPSFFRGRYTTCSQT